MTKRLKYTKDILTHMLNNNTHNTNTGRNGGGSITPSSSTNVAHSQNIYPGAIPNSAATGKRSELMMGGTMSQGFGVSGQDFASVAGSSINIPQSAALGSHRRPLNILNN